MIRFAENLNKMIAAGLGGAMEPPLTEVAVGHCIRYLEASGAVASFGTNIAAPIRSLRVDMPPIQDLHGQANPYPAGGGKNKFDLSEVILTVNESAQSFSWDTDGLHRDIYTGISGAGASVPTASLVKLPYLKAGTYVCSFSGSFPSSGITIRTVDDTGATTALVAVTASGTTFTLDTDTRITIRITNQSNNVKTITKFQIEEGSTATSYAPYENICPISGRDSVTVMRTGKNLFNKTTVTPTRFVSADGTLAYSANYAASDYIPVKAGVSMIVSGLTASSAAIKTAFYDREKVFISAVSQNKPTYSFTTPSGAEYARITVPNADLDTAQLEIGSTPSAYASYDSASITVQLGQTVYGGTLDVSTGKLTVTHGEIASYNGEVLTGEWISDRNVYAAGTTPTIGAQVVYVLDTPQTIDLDPQQITTLKGDNNVWSDAGNISLEYPYYEETEGY